MTQTYEAWRITYQSSEQAARAAFERMMKLEQGKCLHQIAEPAEDIWPCINIDVDEHGAITNAKLYSPGLPAGNHDVYPVRVPYMDEHTEAWLTCVKELERFDSSFLNREGMNGLECAASVIRELVSRAQRAAAPQAVQPAVPAGGQSRFKGEKDWQWCSPEHVAMVLATPSEWQGYEVRYLYAAPAHPVEGVPEDGFELWWADHMPKSTQTEAWSAWIALHQSTHPTQQGMDAQLAKLTTAYKELSGMFHDQVVAQQAAWIEWQHGNGAEAGMQWIENGLCGPGHIPDEDEPYGKEAQAWFDANRSDPFPTCNCGKPSNQLWMGHGFCSEAHYDEFRAAQAKQGGA